MPNVHPRGIRARVTAITIAVTCAAMIAIVGLTAWASWTSVRDIIERSLVERLDYAQAVVEAGDLERAVDDVGYELLQVVDAKGNVIASTENAHGLPAIKGERDSEEVDDLTLERDEEDEDEPGQSDDPVSETAAAADAPSDVGGDETTTGGYGGGSEDGDDDESDDADSDADHEDDDDGAEAADSDEDDDGPADDSGQDGGEDGSESTDESEPADDEEDGSDSDDDGEADDESDDVADDGEDEQDDDSDDETSLSRTGKALVDQRAPRAFPVTSLADVFGPRVALADDGAQDTVTVSEVLDAPGPFIIMRRKVASPAGPVTLVAMTSVAPAVEAAQKTAWQLGVILSALLVAAGLFAWHMTGRMLRPVNQMRSEVEAISPNELDRRVTPPENDPDLLRLANTFNGLLERVEAALSEQKRFVSDASHELKSPIAATSLMLDVLSDNPGQLNERQVVQDLAAENGRMERIVSDLLVLARQDEGRITVQPRLVDYCDLLYEETDSLRRRYDVEVDDCAIEPVVGQTDPDLLSHALRNLLDNAARYASASVRVSCRQLGDQVEIRISDDGPGISPEDRDRVFGRFVRLESDRSRAQGSTGLGLAVTKGNIEQLGGTVRFCEPDFGGATAQILLPL